MVWGAFIRITSLTGGSLASDGASPRAPGRSRVGLMPGFEQLAQAPPELECEGIRSWSAHAAFPIRSAQDDASRRQDAQEAVPRFGAGQVAGLEPNKVHPTGSGQYFVHALGRRLWVTASRGKLGNFDSIKGQGCYLLASRARNRVLDPHTHDDRVSVPDAGVCVLHG
jgi:hypothetical protein